MSLPKFSILIAVSLLISSCQLATSMEDAPAIVFVGGTILPVDPDFSEQEAFAIRGNRILAVGSKSSVMSTVGNHAERIELDGAVVLPGFIDPHTHILAEVKDAKNSAVKKVLESVSRQMSLKGITTVGEMGIGGLSRGKADWDLLTSAAREGFMKTRVRVYLSDHFTGSWHAAALKPEQGDEWVRLTGYKIWFDGSHTEDRTAMLREPYLGTDKKGAAHLSAVELQSKIKDWALKGFQISVHGNGDAGIDRVLDAIEAARAEGVTLKRPIIQHCSIIQDDQLMRMKDLDVTCSVLIGSIFYLSDLLRDEILGAERMDFLARAKGFEKHDLLYSVHSDFPVFAPEPLQMIETLVSRRAQGDSGVVVNPGERVSVESAIRAVTSNAAWQLMSEHEVGSLEPGKLADFVILDRDPRNVSANQISEIKIIETWLGGERVTLA